MSTQLYLSRGEYASIVKTRAHPTLEEPIMTCTTIVRKMKGQKTGRLLCGGDSVGFAAVLVCCQRRYTTGISSH